MTKTITRTREFEIVGSYPMLERIPTGLWSFDRAVGNPQRAEYGLMLRSTYELYGPPEAGKSTFAYYLGTILRPDGTILLASLEMADRRYIEEIYKNSGFKGILEFPEFKDEKGKWLGHSKMLTDAVNRLGREEEIVALILDSIAAVVPPAREDNQIGEGYMTDRARFMNDMAARVEAKMFNRTTPALFLAINHSHQSLDPRKKGHITPGGEGIKYHGAARIYIYRKEMFADKDTGLLKGFVAQGQAEKLRFGGRGRKFVVYIVPGRGVSVGMTAMFDAFNAGLAERTKTGHIKMLDAGMGRIGTFVDAAYDGKDKKFEPFIEALANYVEELRDGEEEYDDVGAEIDNHEDE